MTPERLAEIKAKLEKPLGNHMLRSDCADLFDAYEALQSQLMTVYDWRARALAAEADLADMEARATQWETACQQSGAWVADFQGREKALRETLAKAREALHAIIDLDHHNMGPESEATKIARKVLAANRGGENMTPEAALAKAREALTEATRAIHQAHYWLKAKHGGDFAFAELDAWIKGEPSPLTGIGKEEENVDQ